ncbi:glycosyltransferase, partial [Georgenia sp. SYP-B2076]|uniref:glycosyltransferase family 2 protein n=1 Tax=Georgenia sp. SYP-B2076 TaxID=2495881 RepID=UPI0013DF5899
MSEPTQTGRPVIIVPAHNEEAVIAAGLRTVLADAAPGEFHVVVACNGCTDATAERARDAAAGLGADVTVLSLPVASKAAAIRAAEEVATGFPRVYLDADVHCPTATVRAMVAAVDAGAAVAVPRRVLDTATAGAVARLYYEGWQALPWVQGQLSGRGAYTLGRRARETFGPFPDGIADDRFVTARVPRGEAVIVGEPVVVRPPGRVADLMRVRRRVYAGNQQLDGPAHDVGRAGRLVGLARTVLARPALVPALATFTAVTAVAKLAARESVRRGDVTWGRDRRRGQGPRRAARRAARPAQPGRPARP